MSDAGPQSEAGWLEKIRQSGIRVDRQGRFIHEGEEVRHDGLRRALFRWLDREPDGRYVLRLDAGRFATLDVDDTPLVAGAARVDAAGAIWLALSDGAEERLDPATLTVDGAGVLRALVRGGRLEARLSSSAAAALADRLTESDGRPALRVGAVLHPIGPRSAR